MRTIFKDNGRGSCWNADLHLGNPAAHYSVKEYHTLVLEKQTIARTFPIQAKPIFLDKLIHICHHLKSLIAQAGACPNKLYPLARDLAFFSVNFFSGNHGSDLGRVKSADVQVASDKNSFVSNQVFGKTLRGNSKHVFAIKRILECPACPSANLQLYLDLASAMVINLCFGFLFRSLDRHGCISANAFTGSAVANRLHKHMSDLSILDGETVHSFRSGCSITLALLGVPLSDIARHVGWTGTNMAAHYTQCDKLFAVSDDVFTTLGPAPMQLISHLGGTFTAMDSLAGFSPIFC